MILRFMRDDPMTLLEFRGGREVQRAKLAGATDVIFVTPRRR
jgi:hypothetical protein